MFCGILLYKEVQQVNKIYTTKEAADRLKISYRKILDLLKDGELKGKKVGNKWRVTEEQIQEYLADSDN